MLAPNQSSSSSSMASTTPLASVAKLCSPSPTSHPLPLPAPRYSLSSTQTRACSSATSTINPARATRAHKEQLIINYTPMVFQRAPIHHRLLDAFNQSASLSYSHGSLFLSFFFFFKYCYYYRLSHMLQPTQSWNTSSVKARRQAKNAGVVHLGKEKAPGRS